ncbi:FG-GAP-like repeat-containing protein [Streptomyces griseosporeus]|uniref:FG-GAP-like repeat-containing protein n=1 Tax=Streptomyces griseosporeus TaxID=1910 RepID=UPI003701C432
MRTAVVVAAALGLSLPLVPLTAAPSPAATAAGELVLPAAPRAVPRYTQILDAGTTGFLWTQEGDDRFLWTEYATGTTTELPQRLDGLIQYRIQDGGTLNSASDVPGYYGRGSDTVAFYSEWDHEVTLQQGAGTSGGTTVVPVPVGHTYEGTFGNTVLTWSGGLHLWRAGDGGAVTDTRLTGLPEDLYGFSGVEDGDARSVVLRYTSRTQDGETTDHWGLADLATGAFTKLPDDTPSEGRSFRLGTDTVLRLTPARGRADLYDRADLTAPPRTVDTSSLGPWAAYGVTGGTLLGVEPMSPDNDLYRGRPLLALTADGTGTRLTTVMDPAAHQLVQAPDGSVLVAGAARYVDQGDLDWGVYRVTRAADGTVTRNRLTPVQPMPAQIHGMSLGSGILTTADNSTAYAPGTAVGGYRSTWLGTSGTPAVTGRSADGPVGRWESDLCTNVAVPRCILLVADGTGRHGRQSATEQGLTLLRANGTAGGGPTLDTGDSSPRLTDLSGRYAVVDGASSGKQYIGEFVTGAPGKVLQQRARVAAAVWGNTLWSGAATGGTVTATRLPAGTAVESFTTRNGCTPSTLQAVGRWVYWTCEDDGGRVLGSGVYDRTTKRTSTAPDGPVLLGDGYLVQYVGGFQSGSGLKLIDLHGGLPAGGNQADLPSRLLADWTQLHHERDSEVRSGWTVDRFGGAVAYADDQQRVHIVPTGVPTSALTAIDSTVTARTAGFSGTWWLSKPAGAWTLAVRDKATGATVRTLSGASARGLLTAAWDGKDATGRLVTNGTYTWTLTAQPADGQGAALSLSGTARVTAGSAAPRDYAGSDGVGDLVTLNSSGGLTVQQGTGTGTLGGKVSGAGWPAGARFVPYGDLSGDRCNDLLVRLSSGELRAYRPGCGKAATPATPYTSLGTGWNQYDVLTSPGDVNGDRLPDLVTRQKSTGDIYLFRGGATGKLAAPVRLATHWTGYKKIIGAGDLNGDGRGDLLVQDTSNELWRYDANTTGTGGFRPRVKVFDDWGAAYNAVVGVGDFTGDGRADLVSRDTSGNLWRNNGDGKGSFGGRTRIATGWQAYTAVM